MEFLPETAAPNSVARIWYMRGDSTVLWRADFHPHNPIPFYRGIDPLPVPHTTHIEWTEDGIND
jgi:hypothetical protein